MIIKISKWSSRLEQEIKDLGFRKLDDKNVKKRRLEIGHEDGITTISEKHINS
jgi:ribosomal protein S8E